MSEWKSNNQIVYGQGQENYDSLYRKTKLNFDQVFELLNVLRRLNAQSGLDDTDTVPYEFRINTQDNSIYMRNRNNNSWVCLGKIAENFGITATEIDAVENGGGVGKISGGLDANKPRTGNSTNDYYLATDSSTIYRWTGNAWVDYLSLDFSKLKDYEKYCVNRDEVATSSKGKILKLDEVTGKANVDITGSPERLLGYEIDVRNLKDDDVLAFDEAKGKIVNKPKDEVKKEDVSYNGEANKIVKVAGDGKAHIDITGDAGSVNGLMIEKTGAKNGQVLSYDNGQLAFVNQVTVETDTFVTKTEAEKFIKTAGDGQIHGTFNGVTTQLGSIKLELNNWKDGDIPVYHKATNTIKNEPKNSVGQGKNLILMDGNRLLGEYNGAETKTVDVANVIANSQTAYVNHLLRLVENLHLALTVAGLDPGGYDGLLSVAYNAATQKVEGLDNTNCLVTSLVKGDDSIDVDHIELLNVGESYRLIEGDHVEDVTIKFIKPVYSIQRVILAKPVQYQFTPNTARLVRSNVTVNPEGKISGDSLTLITKPAMFNVIKSRCHLVVKHQVSGTPTIKAYVAFRNSFLGSENFVPMSKCAFYIDQNNQDRGSTEFVFTAGRCTCGNANCNCGTHGGSIATIKIIATGSPVVIDSFAGVFNE